MQRPPSVPGFLEGGGALGALMRIHDWASTPLGAPESWPANLQSTLGLCLDSAFPIAIYWGPDLLLLYNDAWSPILGEKHPWALGRPATEVWPEIWDAIDPVFAKVMQAGVGVFNHDSLLAMHRHGYVEECYFDYTFNPIRSGDSNIAGIFNVVAETTYRVINERRYRIQRDFAALLAGAKTAEQVIELALQGLKEAGLDVPFAAFYRPAEVPSLVGAVGSEAGTTVHWPLEEAARSSSMLTVPDVVERFGPIPSLAWPEPIREALILPLAAPGRPAPDYLLVAGASPRRGLDPEYIAFFQALANHIGTAFANAEAFEAQRRRAEVLAELDRAKTTFFSNVSHEFRTPLTLMLGPVQDLLDQADSLAPHSREQLAVVQRNGQRLLKLVNSLLDFSRLEAGRAQAVFEQVDLAAFTAELASVFRAAIEKAGMHLLVSCEATPEPVFVDRDMWEKIVLNLVANAFKYTLQGEISVRLRSEGGLVRLSVQDTGIGIPEDELPKIFHRFHRVEGARGRTQEGSGIGLALVDELVRLHGGSVEVQSVQGHGSRFTVSLPLGKTHLVAERAGSESTRPSTAIAAQAYVEEALRWMPEASAPVAGLSQELREAPADGPTPKRARIILADDNADMREYVARLLATHEVIAVADGAQAVAEALAQPPDLVLTDVMMPGLDGFGLLKALRADPATATVPVIMLSARAGEEASLEGRSAGADDYLVKPFSARELLARVEAQLALRRVRHEALEREQVLRTEAETLNAMAEQLTGELDLEALVQKVTDAATTLTGAKFGAFFYNVVNSKGEAYQLYTLSGAPREAFEKFGMPRNTPIFAPTFRGEAAVRIDDVKQDARYGTMSPHHGQPNGHLPVTSYLAVPVKTREGEVLGGLFFGHPDAGVFTDHAERLAIGIAALAAVAMDNARLYQALRDADRRKDEFLATLAHELRNPLAPLRTGVELLQRLAPEHQALAPICRMMERQLGHIVRLIDDLLDLSRISLGKVTLQKAPLELAKAVQSAVEASRPILEARKHRLSVSMPPDTAWVDADATRLAQVFSNLLHNAAKFTAPGGLIEVHVEQSEHQVELSVKDNGIGVPEPMLERIFEMFSQIEDPMHKTQPGLGIGLTLVRQLVELHGGTVRAESEGAGQGSTFRVLLPLLAHAPGSAPASGERRRAAAPLRVLIADDNVDAALTLEAMLAIDGHVVRTVHNGAAAVREAATFQPQVILLDLGMPDMSGFEACRRIREQEPASSRMVIAALTGWGQDDAQSRGRESGFDRHLIKPAEPEVIQALLAEVAGQQESSASR